MSKTKQYTQESVQSLAINKSNQSGSLSAEATQAVSGNRTGRELIEATRPFAQESRTKSWWHVCTIFALLVVVLAAAGIAPWWPVRLLLSVLGAFLMLRAFITYHDYMHGSILQNSSLASFLFHSYASLCLVPAASWKMSHNYHHGHVGKVSYPSIGAFPLVTSKTWFASSFLERVGYRLQRHPLVVLFGYITIFAFSVCLMPFLRQPFKYWDSLVSIIAHASLITLLYFFGGFDVVFFVVLLPMFISSLMGAYLFYAQHSFEQMKIISPEKWSFHKASLESSSYMKMNKIMEWFTGNIGYHHIHHLNVQIPFYRLPEAMKAIPELQSPAVTSLSWREIVNCFRLSLWDEDTQRMVSYREAKSLLAG
jgi:omega-6 fatty acid desaturase (delta-12 desaturase)